MRDRAWQTLGQTFRSMASDRASVIRERRQQEQDLTTQVQKQRMDREPLSPRKWIENEYFAGSLTRMWDSWKELFVEIYEKNYFEILLGGAIGKGKTAFARLCHVYSMYLLTCYGIPQRAFRGMMDTDIILMLNMNTNDDKAKDAYFNSLRVLIYSIPYFRDEMKIPTYLVNEVRIPSKGILSKFSGATRTAAESEHLVFVIYDEINLYEMVENSKRALGENKDGKHMYDAAEVVYEAGVRRMRTRYMLPAKDGTEWGQMPLPCKVIPLCRETYPNSFMRRRMKEVSRLGLDTMGITMVIEGPEWGPKPKSMYCGRKFYVRTGTLGESARILKPEEVEAEKEKELLAKGRSEDEQFQVIECPVEWRDLANKDIAEFLRDICGIPTEAIGQFFRDRSCIYRAHRMADPENGIPAECCMHPFTEEVTDLRSGGSLMFERLARRVQDSNDREKFWHEPLVDPGMPRFAHLDVGLTGDPLGLAVGHMRGIKNVTRFGGDGQATTERAPITWFDLVLRVVPVPGQEIQLAQVRQILFKLREWGYRFQKITSDSFQSRDGLQAFAAVGIDTDILSVDVTPVPYKQTRSAYQEDRISMYPHPPLEGELVELEIKRTNKTRDGQKVEMIDHPPRGMKDEADACAAVCSMIEDEYAKGSFSFDMPVGTRTQAEKVGNDVKRQSEDAGRFERGDFEAMFEEAKKWQDS